MDKTVQYYIRKINESIANSNKTDAQMYYKKAVDNVGEIPEILDLKSKINTLREPVIAEPKPVDNLETRKTKRHNETKISLIAVGIAIIIFISYLSIFVFPKHNLKNKLVNEEWYQGDVSSYTSNGIILEFNSKNNYDFEIIYRLNRKAIISEFKGEVLNGHRISVNGQIINVRFEDNGEKVIFSPSFVDLSEESVWKKYSIIHENEPFYGNGSSKSESYTSNKTDTYSSNNTDFSSNTVNQSEHETSSEDYNTTNNSDNTSKYGSSNTDKSVPGNTNSVSKSTDSSSTTQTTSKPTVNKDPCANGHDWAATTKTIHHDEVGHYEMVQVSPSKTWYRCPCCGKEYYDINEYYTHFDNNHKVDSTGNSLKWLRSEYTHGTIHAQYEEKWIVDKKAYDEKITTYKCSRCDATK